MRLSRSRPELPGKRLFPAAVCMSTSNLAELALPAILIHKDEGADGDVTGPGQRTRIRETIIRPGGDGAGKRRAVLGKQDAGSFPVAHPQTESACKWL